MPVKSHKTENCGIHNYTKNVHVENVHDQLNMMISDIMERYPQLGSR